MNEILSTLGTKVEAELRDLMARAKAAWNRGEQAVHAALHKEASTVAAPHGVVIEPVSPPDGTLVAKPATKAPAPLQEHPPTAGGDGAVKPL